MKTTEIHLDAQSWQYITHMSSSDPKTTRGLEKRHAPLPALKLTELYAQSYLLRTSLPTITTAWCQVFIVE